MFSGLKDPEGQSRNQELKRMGRMHPQHSTDHFHEIPLALLYTASYPSSCMCASRYQSPSSGCGTSSNPKIALLTSKRFLPRVRCNSVRARTLNIAYSKPVALLSWINLLISSVLVIIKRGKGMGRQRQGPCVQ